MVPHLFLKAKVALSIGALLLLTGLSEVKAQYLPSVRLSYSCQSVPLGKVLDHLSQKTGASFVYSSSKISLHTPITLSVKDKPLNDVLTLLSQQLNLSFKIQGHHVTLKSIERPAIAMNTVRLTSIKKIDESMLSRKTEQTVIPAEPQTSTESTSTRKISFELPSSDNSGKEYLLTLFPKVESHILKKIPAKYIRKIATQQSADRWFVSAGTLVNDYSLGLELQAGLRQAYAVFSPTWMANGTQHESFGLGTSFRLSQYLSLNPVYTIASLKTSGTYQDTQAWYNAPVYSVNTSTHHHQLKLMLQYTFGKSSNLRLGPTFNQTLSTSAYQLSQPPSAPKIGMHNHYGNDGDYFTNYNPEPRTLPSITTQHFWVGWEVSFSYRINFSRKP